MTALIQDRNAPYVMGELVGHPVAAAAMIYAGALVCLSATGYLVPGTEAADLVPIGRSEDRYDNTAGQDGDIVAQVRCGIFEFVNDPGAPLDRTHIGKFCYIVDDQTVSASHNTNARSVAGRVHDITTTGVRVHVGPLPAAI